MDVQVFSRNQLISRVRLGKDVMSHLISIANPAFGPEEGEATGLPGEIEAAFEEVLRLRFFDVEDDGDLPPAWREGLAGRADVEAVIRFVDESREEARGYTLHCAAGVSRSTATALGVLYMLRGNEKLAAEELVSVRPEAMPLPRVLRLFDELLGSNLEGQLDRINELRRGEVRRRLLRFNNSEEEEPPNE